MHPIFFFLFLFFTVRGSKKRLNNLTSRWLGGKKPYAQAGTTHVHRASGPSWSLASLSMICQPDASSDILYTQPLKKNVTEKNQHHSQGPSRMLCLRLRSLGACQSPPKNRNRTQNTLVYVRCDADEGLRVFLSITRDRNALRDQSYSVACFILFFLKVHLLRAQRMQTHRCPWICCGYLPRYYHHRY